MSLIKSGGVLLLLFAAVATVAFFIVWRLKTGSWAIEKSSTPADVASQFTDEPSAPHARLIAFIAHWCPASQALKPVWDRIDEQVDGKLVGKYSVKAEWVDAEADPRLASIFKVQAYPTIVLVTKQTVWTYNGAPTFDGINAFVKSCLG